MTEMPKLFEQFLPWAENIIKTRYPTADCGVDLEMEDVAWLGFVLEHSSGVIKLFTTEYYICDISSNFQEESELFMNDKINADWDFDKEFSIVFEKIDEIEKRNGQTLR